MLKALKNLLRKKSFRPSVSPASIPVNVLRATYLENASNAEILRVQCEDLQSQAARWHRRWMEAEEIAATTEDPQEIAEWSRVKKAARVREAETIQLAEQYLRRYLEATTWQANLKQRLLEARQLAS